MCVKESVADENGANLPLCSDPDIHRESNNSKLTCGFCSACTSPGCTMKTAHWNSLLQSKLLKPQVAKLSDLALEILSFFLPQKRGV